MANIDLDAMRRARAETRGEEQGTVTFGGETFELPAELPFTFGDHLMAGELRAALKDVLGDQLEAFLVHGPSYDDFRALTDAITLHYTGKTPGESSASDGS